MVRVVCVHCRDPSSPQIVRTCGQSDLSKPVDVEVHIAWVEVTLAVEVIATEACPSGEATQHADLCAEGLRGPREVDHYGSVRRTPASSASLASRSACVRVRSASAVSRLVKSTWAVQRRANAKDANSAA